MAKLYKVSADVSEKEKAIGGVMTFAQGGWLGLGLLLGVGFFLLLRLIMPLFLALILGVAPFAALGGVFAFTKREGFRFQLIWSVNENLIRKHPVW